MYPQDVAHSVHGVGERDEGLLGLLLPVVPGTVCVGAVAPSGESVEPPPGLLTVAAFLLALERGVVLLVEVVLLGPCLDLPAVPQVVLLGVELCLTTLVPLALGVRRELVLRLSPTGGDVVLERVPVLLTRLAHRADRHLLAVFRRSRCVERPVARGVLFQVLLGVRGLRSCPGTVTLWGLPRRVLHGVPERLVDPLGGLLTRVRAVARELTSRCPVPTHPGLTATPRLERRVGGVRVRVHRHHVEVVLHRGHHHREVALGIVEPGVRPELVHHPGVALGPRLHRHVPEPFHGLLHLRDRDPTEVHPVLGV